MARTSLWTSIGWLCPAAQGGHPHAPTYRWQLEYETGAQLLNYPDAPAPRGSQLVPEVAAALPVVSDGGRTYTFRIRPGFRFSPPSNQPVTAQTFKYSIERALSPGLGPAAPGYGFLHDVAGAAAFHAGKARHISGIVARGDTLTVRLVAPADDFLARLSMPFFAAVPIGTPIVDGGVQSPIPAAGPYYLKVAWQDDLRVLERNPNYHGPRPHRLARIVYDINDSTHRTVERIKSGTADYTADVLHEPVFASDGPLAAQHGRAASERSGPLLVQTAQAGFRFLQFNTGRGPFTDVRLRRAVNYAIDRRALAAVLHDQPAESYIPAGLPGSPHTRVYPLSPDLARARALDHGFHGRVTLSACAQADCTATARIIRANLARIGIRVKIVTFANPEAPVSSRARYDMLLNGWFFDYPDPSEVLNGFLDPEGFRIAGLPPPLPIPASYRRSLVHAALLRGPARAAAYQNLSLQLERNVAPFAVYSVPVQSEFLSGRIGCRTEQPVTGAADIGSLCVRGH